MNRDFSCAQENSVLALTRARVKLRKRRMAIQVGAVSYLDEAIETVLDILREKARVSTLWLNTYTWDHGSGGRQLQNVRALQTRRPHRALL